jgi:hypothetical protein
VARGPPTKVPGHGSRTAGRTGSLVILRPPVECGSTRLRPNLHLRLRRTISAPETAPQGEEPPPSHFIAPAFSTLSQRSGSLLPFFPQFLNVYPVELKKSHCGLASGCLNTSGRIRDIQHITANTFTVRNCTVAATDVTRPEGRIRDTQWIWIVVTAKLIQ